MHRVEFTKTHCGGNDFVLIGEQRPGVDYAELARRICRRKTGVGADGLLIVSRTKSSFSIRYLNSDGSEASFCGNGLFCAGKWVRENGYEKSPILFCWNGKDYEVLGSGEDWKARIPGPTDLELDVKLESGDAVDYVRVGVPHAVRFEPELDTVDVMGEGRAIRSDPAFLPEGVNVDFCAVVGRNELRLRTYERGVEAETLSCGSGAAAACVIAHRREMVDSRVVVLALGGSTTVEIGPKRILLWGKPETVYSGTLGAA
jgi:diaminopimelate epimerase